MLVHPVWNSEGRHVQVFFCKQFLLAGIKVDQKSKKFGKHHQSIGVNKTDPKLDWIKHLASTSLHSCPYWSAVIEHDKGIDWLKQFSGIWDLKAAIDYQEGGALQKLTIRRVKWKETGGIRYAVCTSIWQRTCWKQNMPYVFHPYVADKHMSMLVIVS